MRHPFCFALLFFAWPLLAQHPPLEHIGIGQGLAAGFVTCLRQDREGFLWVGTQNGLNRYDGHRIQVFSLDPFDSLTLSNNNISAIYDVGDFLLVGTLGGGLNIFHKKTERFFRVPFETKPNAEKRMPGNTVVGILIDPAGTIWVTTGNYASGALWLCRMDMPRNFWEQLPKMPELVTQLIFSNWYMPDKTRDTWFAINSGGIEMMGQTVGCFSGEGWSVYNPATQQLEEMPLPTGLAGQMTRVVVSSKDGSSFWQNYTGETWHRATVSSGWERLPGTRPIILFFNQEFLLTRGKDLFAAYRMHDNPHQIDFSQPLWTVPTQDKRTIFLFDRSGNFWWAEQVQGAYKYSPQKDCFRHYFSGTSVMNAPTALPEGNIIFSKDDQFHWTDQASDQPLHQALAQYDLTFNTIHLDPHGQYWRLGTRASALPVTLIRTDPGTGRSQHWNLPFHILEEHDFAFDEKGWPWLAIEGRLIRFNPDDGTYTTFDFQHLAMNDEAVMAMARTGDGSWWLGTKYGLIRARPNARQQFDFQLFKTNPADRNSLSSVVVASLLPDPADPQVLWIGTKGGGLNRLDITTNHFSHLTTKSGLPDNVVYGILADAEKRLWLSTNRGLVRYNPVTGEIKNYRQADGLQSDEFNTRAYGKGLNGELMFGGVNGLNVFQPKDLRDNPVPPNVFFTGLKINDLPVAIGDSSGILTAAMPFAEGIVLPFSKNNITLEFAALEFTTPSKNHYRYHLAQTSIFGKQADREWEHEGPEPTATYLNLQPGDYTFIVQAANGDGVWNDTPKKFHIRVLPPWYRSWWAYATYTLLLGGLVFWYWRTRENRITLEKTLAQKEREAEQAAWALEREHQAAENAALELETVRLEAKVNQTKLEEFTRHLLEKSQLITALQAQVNAANHPQELLRTEKREQLYHTNILTQADWEMFKSRFEQAYPGFQEKLETHYPQLSPNELRLLLLAKIGLTTATEVASMLGISAEAVRKARHRLRKKLDMPDASLEDIFLIIN